jgi:hypothetical protein
MHEDLTLQISSVNLPTPDGDPVILHVFTVNNKGLVDALMTLDLNGSEDILIENLDDPLDSSRIVSRIIPGCSFGTILGSVRELPHSKMIWNATFKRQENPEEWGEETKQRIVR